MTKTSTTTKTITIDQEQLLLVVLFDYDYQKENGEHIVIKQGEKLNLVAKYNNQWWLVNRFSQHQQQAVSSISDEQQTGSYVVVDHDGDGDDGAVGKLESNVNITEERTHNSCEVLKSTSTTIAPLSSPLNHPFFVPTSCIEPVLVGEQKIVKDNNCDYHHHQEQPTPKGNQINNNN